MNQDNGSTKSAAELAARNVADLAHDAITLAELQTRLLTTETKQGLRGLVLPLVLLAVAAALALGCVPVLLLSLAFALVQYAQWSLALSLLLAVFVGAAVGAIAAWIAIARLRRNPMRFKRSRDEFAENVSWIKLILKRKSQAIEQHCR